jgi:ribose transport system permease protein
LTILRQSSPHDAATTRLPFAGIKSAIRAAGMIPALVIVLVVGALVSPDFHTPINFINVLKFASIVGLMAIGQTFVVLSGGGGIDLSVGAVCAASGVVGGLFAPWGLGSLAAATLLASGLFGAINGLGITRGRLPPFIVTLATMTIATGLALYLSKASPLELDVPGLSTIQSGSLGPLPFPIVLFALAVIVATIVLRKTVFGRELYAIGGNEEAARLSGVATDRHRLLVYLFSGLLAGLASLLLMAFTQTADPNAAKGYELQSIAAVVVGGTPLSGGVGSALSSTVGVLIIAFVSNIMVLMNIDPTMQQVFTGVIVLAAVSVEVKAFAPGGVSVLGRLKQLGPFYALWLLLAVLVTVLVLRPPS